MYVMSFSKVASFWRELRVFSLAMREKASLGPDIAMSEVEVETTGERRDLRVMLDSEMTG